MKVPPETREVIVPPASVWCGPCLHLGVVGVHADVWITLPCAKHVVACCALHAKTHLQLGTLECAACSP